LGRSQLDLGWPDPGGGKPGDLGQRGLGRRLQGEGVQRRAGCAEPILCKDWLTLATRGALCGRNQVRENVGTGSDRPCAAILTSFDHTMVVPGEVSQGREDFPEMLALQGIATILAERYPRDNFPAAQEGVRKAIDVVQKIYRDNFFPEMNASWDKYPDNIGHMIWPGCFRCHDGKHNTADGKRSIQASDCNTCHTILAQGQGDELNLLTPGGQKFKHPGDEVDGAWNDCHTGGL